MKQQQVDFKPIKKFEGTIPERIRDYMATNLNAAGKEGAFYTGCLFYIIEAYFNDYAPQSLDALKGIELRHILSQSELGKLNRPEKRNVERVVSNYAGKTKMQFEKAQSIISDFAVKLDDVYKGRVEHLIDIATDFFHLQIGSIHQGYEADSWLEIDTFDAKRHGEGYALVFCPKYPVGSPLRTRYVEASKINLIISEVSAWKPVTEPICT